MSPALLDTIGGLGLFLLGMVVMTDALRSMAGRSLRRLLARFTRSPASGVMTGAVSTAVIQSSSATTVAAVGFVGAGLLTFPQALGVVLGANLGTTITGWLIALLGFKLKIGAAVLPLVFIGVVFRIFGRRRWSHFGTALAGFSLIFLGIEYLQEGLGGLESIVTPESFPGSGWGGLLFLVLIGVAITLVTQSSSAGIAAAMTALSTGAIRFDQAAAMVIGMNLGTTCTALLATLGTSTAARRTGYSHVIFNCFISLGAFFILPLFILAANEISDGILTREPELGLVAFHTFFNGLGVLLVAPFTTRFARLVVRLVPSRQESLTGGLDDLLLGRPEAALIATGESLRRIGSATFRILEKLLHEKGAESKKDEIDEIEAALRDARAYLERLVPGSRVQEIERPYADAIHILDHLDRLADRCRRRRNLRPDRIGGELTVQCESLEDAIDSMAVSIENLDEAVATIEPIWRQLDVRSEPLRKEVLKMCASGELELEHANDRLAAARWLRRTAYHVWRIAHHLRRLGAIEERGQ